MKTAAKICFMALTLAGGGLLFPAEAGAEAPGPSSAPTIAAPTVRPPTAASLASVAGKTASEKEILPADLDKDVKDSKDKDKKDNKSDLPPSPKVPDSVKDVVKHLTTATKDVTLEDLNAAREAVVKLDVLIDIEKRLNDLANLRKEREEKSVSLLASALPASAFGGLKTAGGRPVVLPELPASAIKPGHVGAVSTVTPAAMPVATPPVVAAPPLAVDVVRVVGSRGHYVATIKEGDGGKTKSVREGDKLSDGSLVASVSRYGVVLSKDKKTRSIEVKDVGSVFSGK